VKDGPVFPQSNVRIAADDGDDFTFCTTCAFSTACLDQGMGKRELKDLHMLVEHIGPFRAGEPVFRRGEPFDAIAAVRGGSVKTTVIDQNGHERVLGFHFPGEVIGLAGIDGDRYPCDAVALDTATLCRFSFPRMAELASRVPLLQQHLFRLLSRDIAAAQRLTGDWPADVRMAAFLLTLSRRLAARGFSPRRFELTMARTDIGNYLRLVPETVSRVLKRFQDDRLLAVDRREVELLDPAGLEALAAPILAS
jgi:CRP/FNR family transcriptional regulator